VLILDKTGSDTGVPLAIDSVMWFSKETMPTGHTQRKRKRERERE
jgi:hypothetical protein